MLAVVLVVGALLVRRNVLDDDDPGSDSTTAPAPETATALVCITELRAVCDALADEHVDVDISIEPAGDTLDRLAGIEDPTDAPLWLTIAPFPEMVEVLRRQANVAPIGPETTPVGASQLAIAFASADQGAAITESCQGAGTLWRCVGDHAGVRWADLGARTLPGTLIPSLGNVADSALGLASFAAAVAGYLDSTDIPSSAQLTADTSFLVWVRKLAGVSNGVRLSDRDGTPIGTMAVRPSALNAAATATFQARAVDSDGDRFALNYPDPEMWVQAVVAVPNGLDAPGSLVDDLVTELGASGWDAPGEASTPLPDASTMVALRERWIQDT